MSSRKKTHDQLTPLSSPKKHAEMSPDQKRLKSTLDELIDTFDKRMIINIYYTIETILFS